MCFVPQRRALFPHRNVQKCSGADVFWHFLLQNVLRATTACTFSTSQLPKVVRDRRVLQLFTSKCASHHKSVHFFDISTSKSRPGPTCFDTFYFQMCFAPRRRALFPTFSRTCIYSLLTFSISDLLPSDFLHASFFLPVLFHLSILSEVSLLNFLRLNTPKMDRKNTQYKNNLSQPPKKRKTTTKPLKNRIESALRPPLSVTEI